MITVFKFNLLFWKNVKQVFCFGLPVHYCFLLNIIVLDSFQEYHILDSFPILDNSVIQSSLPL